METKRHSKGSKRPIHVLSPEQVGALMRACNARYTTGKRSRALIALLFGSGLRVAEALAVKPGDLDLEGLEVTVVEGKGSKPRKAALLPAAVAPLAAWLEHRRSLGLNGRSTVFCGHARGALGKPLAPSYVRALLPRLAARVPELDGLRVHAHGLRHSYAAMLDREGYTLTEVQQALGHTRASVTGAYLAHVSAHRLSEAHRGRLAHVVLL